MASVAGLIRGKGWVQQPLFEFLFAVNSAPSSVRVITSLIKDPLLSRRPPPLSNRRNEKAWKTCDKRKGYLRNDCRTNADQVYTCT